jgi:polysaccharide deacetylase family protein (PEP-CTERM system associated)
MIFSIDVEDWAQSVLNNANPVSNRVYDNTLRLIDILDKHQHKATFFTLGNVAKKHPDLIRRITDAGHEVASHGYNHDAIFKLTPKQVMEDVTNSVKYLEDASGTKVIGFRAPNFSIREYLFEWYCEALAENGLKYDSSLFPMKVIKYGIEKKYSLKIFNEYGIHEHYLSYMKLGKHKLPFFGGGYFRLLPYPITKSLSSKLNEKRAVFYMHPYEIDTGELAAVKNLHGDIPLKWRLSQFVGRGSVESKLHKLMSDYRFTSFEREFYSDDPQATLSTSSDSLKNDSIIINDDIDHSNIAAQLKHC